MANRATQSLTAGLKFFGGSDVTAFTLEYLTTVGSKKQGSFETIVVPYAEIGRDSSCAITIDSKVQTVSRRHAAIERKGDETFIVNLSSVNPTLVNGRPVKNRYYLNNGDEIQLSLEGPRFRYNTSTTGTMKIGATKRLNLLFKQSIRPYKSVMLGLGVLLLLVSTGATYGIYSLSKENEVLNELIVAQGNISENQAKEIERLNQQNDSLAEKFEIDTKSLKNSIALERKRLRKENQNLLAEIEKNRPKSIPKIIGPIKEYCLAIFIDKIEVSYGGRTDVVDQDDDCMCTGFLTNDGRFLTARHCIDAMLTEDDELNFIEHSGGSVTFHFIARSYNGNTEFRFTNKQMKADYSKDLFKKVTFRGVTGVIRRPDYFSGADWAVMSSGKNQGFNTNSQKSSTLKGGDQLHVLGYSYGERYRTGGNLDPYYSSANVTLDGLQNGTIHTTGATFDGGNSGGPVFVIENNTLEIVGIVTGKFLKPTGSGVDVVDANIQILTPIANIK